MMLTIISYKGRFIAAVLLVSSNFMTQDRPIVVVCTYLNSGCTLEYRII